MDDFNERVSMKNVKSGKLLSNAISKQLREISPHVVGDVDADVLHAFSIVGRIHLHYYEAGPRSLFANKSKRYQMTKVSLLWFLWLLQFEAGGKSLADDQHQLTDEFTHIIIRLPFKYLPATRPFFFGGN